MSRSIQITIPVKLDVDLTDYARAYGMTEEEAEKDAREYLPRIVANTLVPATGDRTHFTVGASDAGVTLTGDLAELVDE